MENKITKNERKAIAIKNYLKDNGIRIDKNDIKNITNILKWIK